MQTQTATRLGDAFLSTPSARRATVLRDTFDYDISISIHALREEGDVPPRASFSSSFYFYPRPPRGGRLNPPTQEEKAHQFLSTPSARRATTRTTYADRAQMISIHALREEGDNIGSLSPGPTQNFYPRPPRGGRPHSSTVRLSGGAFLSTPSARRATMTCFAGISFILEFLSTPSARRATYYNAMDTQSQTIFLSTPSARRATHQAGGAARPPRISIHALREEGDKSGHPSVACSCNFYPRPPRGGRPSTWARPTSLSNFYPRPPRGGRLQKGNVFVRVVPISIHALREEGDTSPSPASLQICYFYPRPPRGGRHKVAPHVFLAVHISIHALREEGDCKLSLYFCLIFGFLSTPSARRATPDVLPVWCRLQISIHALREEGDAGALNLVAHDLDFYPRPPRGGRPRPSATVHRPRIFLSTPSARRATFNYEGKLRDFLISIHALREEGDGISSPSATVPLYFYPRPPRGGRRGQVPPEKRLQLISIHALREEGDCAVFRHALGNFRFLSTPSARRATPPPRRSFRPSPISIHALREEGDTSILSLHGLSREFLSTPSARRATFCTFWMLCR